MSLKSCEKAETNVYALEISLEGEEFKKAVSNAYNKNKGRYNVPGFRKGKAPKHIIETYYGKEVFWYDAIDAEYPELFDAAAKEAGIVPVAAPFDDEIVSLDENGFVISTENRDYLRLAGTPQIFKYELYEKALYDATTSEVSVTDDNMLMERNFKFKVMDWLNNGEVKYFKSPAEGSYLIRLMNVSLTPND